MNKVSLSKTSVFVTSGAVAGAGYYSIYGGVGMTVVGTGVSIGVVPLVAGGVISGAALHGFVRALDGDAAAIGSGLLGTVGGASVYLNIGGVGLAGSFGAFGLGMGGLMAAGGIFGLGVYALLGSWARSSTKEPPQAIIDRMEEKVLDREVFAWALQEVAKFSSQGQDEEVKRKFHYIEIDDELNLLKEQKIFSAPANFSKKYYRSPAYRSPKTPPQNETDTDIIKSEKGVTQVPVLEWEEVRRFKAHQGSINAISLHPDGKTLVTASDDKTVNLWDLETGHCSFTFFGTGASVLAVNISPDGCTLVSGGADRKISRWDFKTRSLQKTFLYLTTGHSHDGWVHSICHNSSGTLLASSSGDQKIRLWNTSTGNWMRTLNGHTDTVFAIALSPCDRYLVSGSADQSIRVWDISTGNQLRVIQGGQGWVNCVAVSPDGRLIASGGSDNSIKIWDLHTGRLLTTLSGHSSAVLAIAFSPDGKTLASGGRKDSIHIWHIETQPDGETSATLNGTLALRGTCLKFSADGLTLFSGDQQGIIGVWQLRASLKGIKPQSDSLQPWWKDLYVDQYASYREVKNAYYLLAKLYHPDLNPSASAKVKMQNINLAYQAYLGTQQVISC